MRAFIIPAKGSPYAGEQFQRLPAENAITCPMSREGNVRSAPRERHGSQVTMARWAMESSFSTLRTKRTARKVSRTRKEARADVFHDIERFHDPRRRHSKPGDLSPMKCEAHARPA